MFGFIVVSSLFTFPPVYCILLTLCFLPTLYIPPPSDDDVCLYSFLSGLNSVRIGPSEIHNIGAVMGGITAQVALKVILRQFIPINNTVLFNGIFGRQKAFEL